jgi:HAD superfamily hydrolase (TIGR01549 family)
MSPPYGHRTISMSLCREPGRLESSLRDVEAVMFDLDGTLIDTIPIYLEMAAAVLEKVGLPPASREAVNAMLKEGVSGFRRLIPADMLDRKAALLEACFKAGREAAAQLYPDSVPLIPGVRTLFRRLEAAGLRIGIVSSSHKEYIRRKLRPLKEAGIDSLVGAVVVREDTSLMKPSPEPVIVCAGRLGVAEQRCLFVGDTDVDIMAGKGAGALTAGVLTGVDDYETLAAQEPDVIIAGVRELVAAF